MTARTHDIIAFGALITAATYFPPNELNISTTFAGLIGSVVGALIPDMDQATNRLWDLLPAGNFFGKIFRNIMLQHRTISHSLLGTYLLYKLLLFVTPKLLNPAYINIQLVVTAVMIGFISHLAADMLTKEGIPLFFPIPLKIGFPPIEALRIPTGKFFEKFIIFPAVVAYLVYFVTIKRETLVSLVKLIKN